MREDTFDSVPEFSGLDYWDEHTEYSEEDWWHEVANGGTRLGYWDWVLHSMGSA